MAITSKRNLLLISILVWTFSSCASTRGYIGPELPESEVSRIYFYSSKGVDSSNLAIDGINQGIFDMGVAVLPGQHRFYAEYSLKGEQCYHGSYCYDRTYRGSCSGELTTEAGKEYGVRLQGMVDSVSVSVTEHSGAWAGSGECKRIGF